MITGVLLGDKALVARVAAMGPAIDAAMDPVLQRLAFAVVRRAQAGYLRGPRPQKLGVKTGRLSSSIAEGSPDSRTHPESEPGKHYYIIGTNVEYAARWEYGFHGTESVRSFQRMQTVAWGRPMREPRQVTVRSFSRNVNINPRPFLAPALNDLKQTIIREIEKAARAAMANAAKGQI